MKVLASLNQVCSGHYEYLVENHLQGDVVVARALVQPLNQQSVLRLLNSTSVPIKLYKGTKLAKLESIPTSGVISMINTEEQQISSSHTTSIVIANFPECN